MEPILRPFRNRLRRRLAFITDVIRKLVAILAPQAREVRSHKDVPVLRVNHVTVQTIMFRMREGARRSPVMTEGCKAGPEYARAVRRWGSLPGAT
jgi:hypothetical protein